MNLIDCLSTLVCAAGCLPTVRPACVMMLALALVPRWPVGQCCTVATAEPAVLEWRPRAVGRRWCGQQSAARSSSVKISPRLCAWQSIRALLQGELFRPSSSSKPCLRSHARFQLAYGEPFGAQAPRIHAVAALQKLDGPEGATASAKHTPSIESAVMVEHHLSDS